MKLAIADVSDGVVHLIGGGSRTVLEVTAVNLALRSPREQEATVDAFRSFLNGLSFPVQVLVRVERLDVESYVASLAERFAREPDPNTRRLGHAQIELVRSLASTRVLLGRRFFVVVPWNEPSTVREGWLFRLRGGRSARAGGELSSRPFDGSQLAARASEVVRGLAAVGLRARRLTTAELLDLYYETLCPTLARLQSLPTSERLSRVANQRSVSDERSNEGGAM